MKYKPELIGARMKEARLSKDLSIKEVGNLIAVAESTVSRYENGKVDKIPLPTIQRIADILGVNINWILGISEKKEIEKPELGYELYPYIPNPVAAGIPETIEGIIELPKIPLPDVALGRYAKRKDLIIMKVNGESMNKTIQNGALIGVITDINVLNLKNGDLVVFNNE